MSVRTPHALGCALCVGLAGATVVRTGLLTAVLLATASLVLAAAAGSRPVALVLGGLGLAVMGWGFGSARLATIDHSVLAPRIGTAERAVVEVVEPPRPGSFELRMRAVVLRWRELRPNEPVLLELPLGRSPPQGARLSLIGQLRAPRGPSNGFDERQWLRRHGIHAVLRAQEWRVVGRRGGLAGVADRLHAWLAGASVPGLGGARRGVIEGVVLGEDQGLSDGLRQDFRASGLYHLLAVSGGNVAVVALGTLWLALLIGMPRLAAEVVVLTAIGGYVLAVGAQPSVVRAGIAGGLGSLGWLAGRERDARYALVVAAVALLAWSPYNALDPGFQLSFAAVLSIFVLAPPFKNWLEGYPLPPALRTCVAVSAACGLATAPISWFQFHQIPLLTVPANAAGGFVVAPMLVLALVCALLAPVLPQLAAALAWANGWLAAYLAGCAHVFGNLPGAQVTSGRAAAALALGAAGAAAYAWRRGERTRAEAGLPPDRDGPAEDRDRAPAAAGADR
ncbi:MAG TPA: ComEC/Rec2 family competence protein [Gaiellaceae bacterium]|nr:ComEC/Rec2 family competence protein [Gaiellaceae bacterium]